MTHSASIILWPLRCLVLFLFALAVKSTFDTNEILQGGRRFDAIVEEVYLIKLGIEQVFVSFVDDQQDRHALRATVLAQTHKVGDKVTAICATNDFTNCKLNEFLDLWTNALVLLLWALICAGPEILFRFTKIGLPANEFPVRARPPVVDVSE